MCLDQFNRDRLEETQVAQKSLLPLGADQLGHARRADIRRLHNHLGQGHFRSIVAEIPDLEFAPPQRASRVDQRGRIGQPQFHRLRRGENLEHRTQLVQSLNGPVEQRAVRGQALGWRARAVVGIEIRQADHRYDLARVHIHQDRRRTLGIHQFHAAGQYTLGGGLDRQID